MTINIVCFKWKRESVGMQLPHVCNYGARHVNVLRNMLRRNVSIPYRFTCVTDDPSGIEKGIEILPLWDKCRFLGGCYNRLFVFSKEAQALLGERILCIDLDCVITSNIDSLLQRPEDLVMNWYPYDSPGCSHQQYYNGGLFLLRTGSRSDIWEKFDPQTSPTLIDERKCARQLCGSDQAWISHLCGHGLPVFSEKDGVLDFRRMHNRNILPPTAKIVLFPGKRDPSLEVTKISWIWRHWR